jgi:hypothetical protein
MIEHLSMRTRLLLASAQSLAMHGELSSTLEQLTEAVGVARQERRAIDAVALSMKKAELLHLECSDETARSIFTAEVDPYIDLLPIAMRVVVDQNRNTVGMTLWDPESVREFYGLVDFRRELRSETGDTGTVAFAEAASVQGRYYDSLPMFWREVLLAYEAGAWIPQRTPQSRLGYEWLKVGAPHHAAYFAMTAQDTDLMDAAANILLGSRETSCIELTLDKVLRSAHLLVHAGLACGLIAKVWDVIPESRFSAVLEFVISRAVIIPANREAAQRVQEAWLALGYLAARSSAEQADRVCEMALGHPLLSAPSHHRKALINTLIQCVPTISVARLELVAEEAAKLVGERRHEIDFDAARNLVKVIADVSDQDFKSRLAEHLGLKSSAAVPQALSALAPVFGLRLAEEGLAKACSECARQIRLQVQYVPPSQNPDTSLSFVSEVTTEKDGIELHVFLWGGSSLLDVVLANHDCVTPEMLDAVVDAMQASMAESENLLANKSLLLEAIGFLADRLSKKTASSVFTALFPLAKGSIAEPSVVSDGLFSRHVLNPIQIDLGDAADVQGRAVCALAKLDKALGGIRDGELIPTIEDAMASLNPAVRVYALASVGELPTVTESLLISVLLATRDGDAKVARCAFQTLTRRPELELSGPQWQAFTYSIKMALQSSDIALRFAAAGAAAEVCQNREIDNGTSAMREIQDLITHDVSHFVRAQWT